MLSSQSVYGEAKDFVQNIVDLLDLSYDDLKNRLIANYENKHAENTFKMM